MSYLVDASVAIKWFVPEIHSDKADALLFAYGGDLEAPDLLLTEVANVAWKKVVRQEITRDAAKTIVERLLHSVTAFHATGLLVERALDISLDLNHPVYDCLYLACAEATNRILITDDQRLQGRVAGTVFESRVLLLSDTKLPDPNEDFLPPLQIPISKVEHIIRAFDILRATDQTIDEAFDERDENGDLVSPFSMESMEMRNEAPSYRALRKFFNDLPKHELAGLIALMWLGRGDGENGDLADMQNEARSVIAEDPNGGYLLSKKHLSRYLTNGLNMLREPPEDDNKTGKREH